MVFMKSEAKPSKEDLAIGDCIVFRRGCLTYQGIIESEGVMHGIVIYEVRVGKDLVGIHDQQVVSR